ncbi:MAG: NAD(P)-binding protein [Candidatus Melainabacteria bacterium]|nr:NAD(P)-binding protein [Candidatus Melainabacteria bacterium]
MSTHSDTTESNDEKNSNDKKFSRAVFLKTLAGCTVAVASGKLLFDTVAARSEYSCRVLGPSMNVGHRIRDRKIPPVAASISPRRKVTIIGGGIAGLSAGWWLKKMGFNDFVILELEPSVGGNSSSGKNAISAYPWGAHYVPLANHESDYVRMFFEEIGVIQGFDKAGLPLYNELYMCHDPEERLFINGSFQEGLVPNKGLQPSDKIEFKRFFEIISRYRQMVGKDGKRAFAIPVDLSSQDPELMALDKMSMADWLKQNNFGCKPLMWYVNYCCRDDYGGTPNHVSAWAGIHYYAGRNGSAGNAETNSVVTWPSGNGFLVEKLREQLKDHIQIGAAVTNVGPLEGSSRGECFTTFFDTGSNTTSGILSQFVICATPRFLAKHVVAELRKTAEYNSLSYSPWMVANISLKKMPEGKGVGHAWDNVCYSSQSLGYVVATHQNITTQTNAPTVITYYYPLTADEPVAEREALRGLYSSSSSTSTSASRSPSSTSPSLSSKPSPIPTSAPASLASAPSSSTSSSVSQSKSSSPSSSSSMWAERIIADLQKMHPGIKDDITSIDLWPWGHGMIRPTVGFIWGDTRKRMKESCGNVFFAHSDMSGISNFEEAQYHGVEAAKQILAKLGIS